MTLLEEHQGLVHKVARRFRWATSRGLDYEDLVQAGTTGLWKATQMYQPDKGMNFASYAFLWIRNHIVREIQNNARTIRIPVHQHQPGAMPAHVRSLEAPISGDADTSLQDLLGHFTDPLEQLSSEEEQRWVTEALTALAPKLRRILELTYWHEKNFREAGELMGFSHEYARQLHQTATHNFKKHYDAIKQRHSAVAR